MGYYIHRTESGRLYGPCMCGAIDCRSCGPAQGYGPDEDEEPMCEDTARDIAAGELLCNVNGCADTISDACFGHYEEVQRLTEDRDFDPHDATIPQCMAVILQSSIDKNTLLAVYRLRVLLETSGPGVEFINERTRELLAGDVNQMAREEARQAA